MRPTLRLSRLFLVIGALSASGLASYQFLARAAAPPPPPPPPAPAATPSPTLPDLNAQFTTAVRPFLDTHCISCHGKDQPQAELDLTTFTSSAAVAKHSRHALLVLDRLKSHEMPPKDADPQPTATARQQAIDWFTALREVEIRRNAGDPGIVLARRLSNAEFDYTIRDLTGVDIRPTREFPVDPANTAGFDNSGESLTMSPALLNKYLKAAHAIASHMYLQPGGFAFAPHPMLVETDRDKHCVQQIISFYHQQNTNYLDYFQAAWRFKHRAALGNPQATLPQIAADNNVSPKYLATLWSALEDTQEEIGPLARLQSLWRALPSPQGPQPDAAKTGCAAMRDYVIQLRKKVEPRFLNITANRLGAGSQPFLIWKNVQYATHRLKFDPAQLQVEGEEKPATAPINEPGANGEFGPGRTRLINNAPGDPDLAVPAGQRPRYEAAFAKFCSLFPDMFYMQERGRNYFDTTKDRGRYLNAGFHSLMGYFRDDMPLYHLLLDDHQQKHLDALWFEMDFVASTTQRMYVQFVDNGNRQSGASPADTPTAAPSGDKDISSELRIRAHEARLLAQAAGGSDTAIRAIKDYFSFINTTLRTTEKARLAAEPLHLDALLKFASRAYRRPLTPDDKADLLAYYKNAREKDGLTHEDALRESIVSILMSPDLCYRIDLVSSDTAVTPLSDVDLASRLSYFLWSSMPDDELMARAAAGDLHKPDVIAAQARRMLKDPRSRALAVEFGGNWLEFRRFEELATVDRDRFTTFTPALRDAMFEEPVRFLLHVFQTGRPLLDLLYANDTFVNLPLARHYGMPVKDIPTDAWVHVPDAHRYDRGGLLPMAAFLTRNSPGLRTSPVKRGNWVVKNLLGERVPPPPPNVPELPQDETKSDLPLREMLAKHRDNPSCASCHSRIDSFGLVFENFGPIGERRDKDLAGRAVDISATFPGGGEGSGLAGLRQHLRTQREKDFLNNLCEKLLVYALGRSPILADELMIQQMHKKLAADGYRFESAVEAIVTSRQFLNKRGQSEELAER